jgi:hypothetical protein
MGKRKLGTALILLIAITAISVAYFLKYGIRPSLHVPTGMRLTIEPGQSQPIETDDYSIDVSIPKDEPFSVGTLHVAEVNSYSFSLERDGMPETALISDITGDGVDDVIIVNRSAGSGGYVEIWLLERTENGFRHQRIPDLPTHFLEGYGGHDVVGIVDGKIARLHPIYRDQLQFKLTLTEFPIQRVSDSNAMPSGGREMLLFDFQHGYWQTVD